MKNSKFLLIIFSLTTIVFITSFTFDIHSVRKTNEETSRILFEADRIAEERIVLQTIGTARSEYAESIRAFEDLILREEGIVPLIEDIEVAGRALGLETRIISVDRISSEQFLSQELEMIRIAVETIGPWTGALNFLRAVENLPSRVIIEEASLSREESWTARVVLLIPYF